MLNELRVENLLLIERAELRLGPGLNVLTGETGAGKTMLAHALDLLLGGKARPGDRPAGRRRGLRRGRLRPARRAARSLGELVPPDADEVVLARRVSAEGRTRALLCGRTVSVGDLRDVASRLVAFYGQHEHRKLTLASAQLELLDGFCGDKHVAARAAVGQVFARVRALEGSLDELRERAGARDRELDLLEFELAEIDEAAPDVAEEEALAAERGRLRHLEALVGASLGAAAALDGEGDEDFAGAGGAAGAVAALSGAQGALDGVAGVDAALDPLAARLRALAVEADDLAGELRRYGSGLEGEPGRLGDRRGAPRGARPLKRKHGGTIAAVLAHAEECRRRRDELLGAEVALEQATAELAAARAELDERAGKLRAARVKAAPKLAAGVRSRLAALAMDGASFEIALSDREPGPDRRRRRRVPHRAEPRRPRDAAARDRVGRRALAGHARAPGHANDGSDATLVFDEVDAGIGGQTARAGRRAAAVLGAGRQVLCITHLPQIASLGARHFSIAKDTSVEPARTTVTALRDPEVVGELVRMLGAETSDLAARRHAQELRKAA
jgi:DNA repair protein RecN (Recombination protein N)